MSHLNFMRSFSNASIIYDDRSPLKCLHCSRKRKQRNRSIKILDPNETQFKVKGELFCPILPDSHEKKSRDFFGSSYSFFDQSHVDLTNHVIFFFTKSFTMLLSCVHCFLILGRKQLFIASINVA